MAYESFLGLRVSATADGQLLGQGDSWSRSCDARGGWKKTRPPMSPLIVPAHACCIGAAFDASLLFVVVAEPCAATGSPWAPTVGQAPTTEARRSAPRASHTIVTFQLVGTSPGYVDGVLWAESESCFSSFLIANNRFYSGMVSTASIYNACIRGSHCPWFNYLLLFSHNHVQHQNKKKNGKNLTEVEHRHNK